MTRRPGNPMLFGMTAIEISGVRKAYGERAALDGVDLEVARGEVLALLGPNGAGKTTLVEILEGHRDPDAGRVSVLGFDPSRRERAFRGRIGVVLQETGLDPAIKVREALELYSAAYPRRRDLDEVLELVGLGDRPDVKASELSGGQRRRLDLALGIVGHPELVFLDEPTTGFDPAARRDAWELVRSLRDEGATVVLTTHYMEEAEALADRL